MVGEGCYVLDIDEIEEVVLTYTYYKIHNIDSCLSHLLQPYLDEYFARQARYEKNIVADSIDGVYIPKNLSECLQQIDHFWTDSLKNEVKNMAEEDFGSTAHFGFGRWMRNHWGLWGGSRLKKYFNAMGIYHADDMSGIILRCYHRYLNRKPIRLGDQIKYYQEYWRKAKEDIK
ncbi:MAG: DUF6794 domain-containing protein [Bacteroidota bacterium]